MCGVSLFVVFAHLPVNMLVITLNNHMKMSQIKQNRPSFAVPLNCTAEFEHAAVPRSRWAQREMVV